MQLEFDFSPPPFRWTGLSQILWGRHKSRPTTTQLITEYRNNQYQISGAVSRHIWDKVPLTKKIRAMRFF